MSTTQNIAEAIVERITGSDLDTALGGRFYHQAAKHNDTLPLLIFDILAYPVERHFNGAISYRAQIHFDIWVPRSTGTAAAGGAGNLEELLFDRFDAVDLFVEPFRGTCLFTDHGYRTIVEDTILISSDALVRGTTTGV